MGHVTFRPACFVDSILRTDYLENNVQAPSQLAEVLAFLVLRPVGGWASELESRAAPVVAG